MYIRKISNLFLYLYIERCQIKNPPSTLQIQNGRGQGLRVRCVSKLLTCNRRGCFYVGVCRLSVYLPFIRKPAGSNITERFSHVWQLPCFTGTGRNLFHFWATDSLRGFPCGNKISLPPESKHRFGTQSERKITQRQSPFLFIKIKNSILYLRYCICETECHLASLNIAIMQCLWHIFISKYIYSFFSLWKKTGSKRRVLFRKQKILKRE